MHHVACHRLRPMAMLHTACLGRFPVHSLFQPHLRYPLTAALTSAAVLCFCKQHVHAVLKVCPPRPQNSIMRASGDGTVPAKWQQLGCGSPGPRPPFTGGGSLPPGSCFSFAIALAGFLILLEGAVAVCKGMRSI